MKEKICSLTMNIEKRNSRYVVQIFSDDYGAIKHYPDPDAVEKLIEYSKKVDIYRRGNTPERYISSFAANGYELYKLFIRPVKTIREIIENSISINTTIDIKIQTREYEINRLPWELIFSIEHDFWTISPYFRILRSSSDSGDNTRVLPVESVKVLFILCLPEKHLSPEKNSLLFINSIRNNLFQVDMTGECTVEELHYKLNRKKYNVVHFSGSYYCKAKERSGDFSSKRRSCLKERMNFDELVYLLTGRNNLNLVFLGNPCLYKSKAESSDLAMYLTSRGVSSVIAMKHALTNKAAKSLERNFYKQIAKGYTIEHAFQLSIKEYGKKKSHDFQWSLPMLFTK